MRLFMGILLLSFTSTATPQSMDGDRALTLMARSLASDDGYANSISQHVMRLQDRSGRISERRLELRTLEHTAIQGERSIIIFHEPFDISGTALLSHARGVEDDLQWLYLPSLRRVKRISGANRAAPFVGSEFAFEDLAPQELAKYEHTWLKEEQFKGLACDVISRVPKYTRSGYSKQHVWIDRDDHQMRKIAFYNRAGQLHKSLLLSDYSLHQGKYWRPHTLHMENHVNGKQTQLELKSIEFGLDLDRLDFEKARLDRTTR